MNAEVNEETIWLVDRPVELGGFWADTTIYTASCQHEGKTYRVCLLRGWEPIPSEGAPRHVGVHGTVVPEDAPKGLSDLKVFFYGSADFSFSAKDFASAAADERFMPKVFELIDQDSFERVFEAFGLPLSQARALLRVGGASHPTDDSCGLVLALATDLSQKAPRGSNLASALRKLASAATGQLTHVESALSDVFAYGSSDNGSPR